MQGKTINGFTLQHLLGTGGMAEVWYAENEIGMKAAVKIMSEKLSHDAQMQERFLNEAKVMVKLDHPNIRKVYGYGNIDGRPAIVMEYLDGSDLKARMKRGQRFTQEELVKWWNQMVDALNYTHAQDIVHRDIKPSNIFVDNKGNAKLLDFGIAKVADTTSGTLTGSTLGTRIYMSPEQVKDPKRVGMASDVYSLAVSFVHLLTGKAPYDSTTSSDYDIQVNIVTKPLDMSVVPAQWQGFLAPYLAKKPEDRPALRPFEAVPSPQHDDTDDETEVTEGPSGSSAPGRPSPSERGAGGSNPQTPAGQAPSSDPGRPSPFTKGGRGDSPTPGRPNPSERGAGGSKPSTPSSDSGPSTLRAASGTAGSGTADKPKKLLWIALGIAAAAFLLVLLLKPKAKPTDPDTLAYEACQTVADYRAYLRDYGRNALHYNDAKAFVEQHEADSTAKAQQAQAQQAQQQGGNGSAGGHDYVDLGLPSGTLWATCNIGASKPEDYGSYFAWGETSTKNTYNWSTYKYANGDYNKLTKYCSKYDCGNNGFTDNLTTMQTGDDPATAKWGSGWRTPSKAQWDELLSNTTKQWTTKNGVKGCSFTSKKNSQTLFLPAAGYYDGEIRSGVSSRGRYWSTSLRIDIPIYSWYLDFNSGQCYIDFGYRDWGRPVRPVREN